MKSKAATGCVLNSNKSKIYTKRSGGTSSTIYKTSPSTNATSGCTFVQSTSACTVSGLGAGFIGNTTTENCPIDDYVWLILVFFGGIGFVYVRNKSLTKSIN